MTAKKVLVVDDETSIREMLRLALEISDFECIEAADIHEAYRLITDDTPDIILLDWMLPGGSGIELLRRLKKEEATQTLPVIMLTAKGEEADRLRGLDGGADDYITKPFSPAELLARARALLRRTTGGHTTILSYEDIEMDIEKKRVSRDQKPIHLGPTEFRLLEHFLRNQGRVYSRSQLLDHVWGDDVYVELRTVDVHIRRLRRALNIDNKPDLIRTVRSMGYALEAEKSS